MNSGVTDVHEPKSDEEYTVIIDIGQGNLRSVSQVMRNQLCFLALWENQNIDKL
ncbi:MAG: hypothetical protein ACTSQ5_05655 [Promethearchaeota archaeon]